MSGRDDFTEATKRDVAMRAGWHCSFEDCRKLLVGPSDESPSAVTKIGQAAHICAAAPGQGARRYDSCMTPEQRKHIDNAIWLCNDHARLVDTDEVTYPAVRLRQMKAAHEQHIALLIKTGSSVDFGMGLLQLGPDIIFSGDITNATATHWTLSLKHMVRGDKHSIITFIDGFAQDAPSNRFVLSNELGDGRSLADAPILCKNSDGYSLLCAIEQSFQRIRAGEIGTDIALHAETGDIFLENGDIALASGVDALPQKVRMLLSMQAGESLFNPSFGVRFHEYFEMFRGSPWLELLLKLEVIRQAAIPYHDSSLKRDYTPLQCVKRVRSIEMLSEFPDDKKRLPVRVVFEVEGLGVWTRDLKIYVPLKEEMEAKAKLMDEHRSALGLSG